MTTALKIILLLFLLATLHGAGKSTLVNARFYFGQEVAEPMRRDCLLPMIWGGILTGLIVWAIVAVVGWIL